MVYSLFFPLTLTGPAFRLGLHGFTIAKDIKSAIKDYGYNMRTLLDVLRGNSAVVDGSIELKLTTLDLATVQRMLEADIEPRTSDILITSQCIQQPDQTDGEYLDSDTISRTFAGAVVYKALLRRHGAEFYKTIRLTASLYGRVGGAASAGGGMWECGATKKSPN